MDGWMDGWIDGWMWIYKCKMKRCMTVVEMYEQMTGRTDQLYEKWNCRSYVNGMVFRRVEKVVNRTVLLILSKIQVS